MININIVFHSMSVAADVVRDDRPWFLPKVIRPDYHFMRGCLFYTQCLNWEDNWDGYHHYVDYKGSKRLHTISIEGFNMTPLVIVMERDDVNWYKSHKWTEKILVWEDVISIWTQRNDHRATMFSDAVDFLIAFGRDEDLHGAERVRNRVTAMETLIYLLRPSSPSEWVLEGLAEIADGWGTWTKEFHKHTTCPIQWNQPASYAMAEKNYYPPLW